MHPRVAALAVLVPLIAAGCGAGGKTITVVTTPATPQLRAYRVPSGSMLPTVAVGEYVYVEALARPLRVGDIIIFHPPKGASSKEQAPACGPVEHVVKFGGSACAEPVPQPEETTEFIKRAVAGPGDEIYIKEGHVYRRAVGSTTFVREPDSYTTPCGSSPECNFRTPIKIPAGDWFTLGDNRGESDDSRFWGPVPLSWVVGVVRACSQLGKSCAGPA